jgi:hypothetical protein
LTSSKQSNDYDNSKNNNDSVIYMNRLAISWPSAAYGNAVINGRNATAVRDTITGSVE